MLSMEALPPLRPRPKALRPERIDEGLPVTLNCLIAGRNVDRLAVALDCSFALHPRCLNRNAIDNYRKYIRKGVISNRFATACKPTSWKDDPDSCRIAEPASRTYAGAAGSLGRSHCIIRSAGVAG